MDEALTEQEAALLEGLGLEPVPTIRTRYEPESVLVWGWFELDSRYLRMCRMQSWLTS